ncbi:protein phosphatase 2C domain-containing protein [Paenibacillus athensensis]|uniref:PPM-type phosphatase domain-containing protein n=1 Tax=Paenibacillus athensensis TaxID=1967502 RepID=A0A4Y8Q739_9BACL|nr:PP2C family serine/threonine-protein phosphatase [Paenibacillus athensensis]MCD1259729.1 protein phosphatase 2C domain-containing protein [Paenibacillus athensensis]
MTSPRWRYAYGSVKGTSHERDGKPCQDHSACALLTDGAGRDVLVAVASDGAGSAACSEAGSALVCAMFVEAIRSFLSEEGEIGGLSDDFFRAWIGQVQEALRLMADAAGVAVREYACTFLAAVVGEEHAAFAQIGDGAIVVGSTEEPDTYSWEFWPQQGEYENTTYFITESKAADKLQISLRAGGGGDEVALFSDGLQRLALHYQSQSAHSPFFRPFFAALREETELPCSDKYTRSLIAFLNSRQVNERTDDDKTLIVATRRPAARTALS